MNKDAIHAETVDRLVDLAIGGAMNGTRTVVAVEDLVAASGSNPALLTAAANQAVELAADSKREQLVTAAEHLRLAGEHLGRRLGSAD